MARQRKLFASPDTAVEAPGRSPDAARMGLTHRLARSAIRRFVAHAPRRLREALLNTSIELAGVEAVAARVLQKLNIIEIGAAGDRGVVTSAWNDDLILPQYARTGTYAKQLVDSFEKFFEHDAGTYIDIGANIGLTTIPIARNPLVRCLAFEPEPVNFSFLERNVARNAPHAAVQLHQVALFERHGSLSLAIANGNIGDHRLTFGGLAGRRSIEIPAVPLDDFLGEIAGKLAIKVDTQGAEPFVIAGGRAVFARAHMVALEFCPFLMRQLGGDPAIVLDLLSGFDRVAVMQGGVEQAPVFVAPHAAETVLRQKLATARDWDGDFLDIIARRDRLPAPP